MPAIRKTPLAVLGLLLLTGLPAFSQEAPTAEETFSDEIEVSLVNLEVIVTDRGGKPIPDLRKEDFEVLEDGKPVELTNFYAESSLPAADGMEGNAANAVAANAANTPRCGHWTSG